MNITSQQYDSVIAICRSLFINKMKDYILQFKVEDVLDDAISMRMSLYELSY